VVANESTAGAYTGITVNGSAETITVSSNHTIQEVYDYCNWWAAQSANMQYDMPLTSADGNTFILANNWDMILNGGSITSGTGKALRFAGTGILQMDGETANNVAVSAGDVHLESATDLTGMVIADDLRIDTGANSTLSFTGMNVSGDVWNDDASHTLTINAVTSTLSAGDPGTGNGQTNIQNAVSLTITGLETGARVRIEETGGTLISQGTESSGSYGDTYNYTGDQGVYVIVRLYGYIPIKQAATIRATGLSVQVQMVEDTIVA
jgi:hypothetical protein